jgi:serine/threonine-protein kinase
VSALVDIDGRVGEVVGGAWTIESVLGAGATSVVYRARHRTGQCVAMKILTRACASDIEVRERFVREAEALRRVTHPNVVQAIGAANTDDGVPLLMMELLEGHTLAQLVRHEKITILRAVDIASAVLSALAACHDRGVLHRDVKPSNVFVTREGRIKLVDFGVARLSGQNETQRRLAIGTLAFMSPEQARGDSHGVTVDVYGAGALLYTLLTGDAPRRGEKDLGRIGREGVVPLTLVAPGLPASLAAVVDRALAWECSERWPSARAFEEALRAIPRGQLSQIDAPVPIEDLVPRRDSSESCESRATIPEPIFSRRGPQAAE